MFRWKQLGPGWPASDVFRVLELLKEQRIPSRMSSDDMFFRKLFCPPHPAHRWEIRVRRRDWNRAIDVLDREGLLNRSRFDVSKP